MPSTDRPPPRTGAEPTRIRRGPSSRTRQVIKAVFSLVLVVGIFYFLFKRIDFADVWAEIRAMTWLELTVLLAIALWNLVTYVFVWMTVTTPRSPGPRYWPSSRSRGWLPRSRSRRVVPEWSRPC